MGCGSSTLAAENPDIQARFRPMIKRCIDDIKRRRSVLKNSTTLSKKELLLGGEDCDKMSSSNNNSRGRNSVPSDGSVQYGAGAAKIVPVVEWEEAETVVKSPEKNEVSREEGEQEKEKEKTGVAADEDEGRCISPGSPSFRVYCVKSVPHDTDEDDRHVEPTIQNLETKDIEENPNPASAAESAEDSATRNRRRIINRKFRRAMRKGGQVKSLMRVGSYYNPACSAHDKRICCQKRPRYSFCFALKRRRFIL